MPISRSPGSGADTVASAFLSFREDFVLTADPELFSDMLLTEAMPTLVYWCEQTVGAVGATIRPQFAPRLTTGIGNPVPEWLDAVPPQVLVPGVVTPIVVIRPSKWMRIGMQRSPGVATTIRVYMASSAAT